MPPEHQAPEWILDSQMSAASDVWALACTIFELRAGYPLFDENGTGTRSTLLKSMVETLGRLPLKWWRAWEDRNTWFHENGLPKDVPRNEWGVRLLGTMIPAAESSLYEKIHRIRKRGRPADKTINKQSLLERAGTPISRREMRLLEDLLRRMLKYHPNDRLTMDEVVRHPWFFYNQEA